MTFELEFPGNLCRAAFAILAVFFFYELLFLGRPVHRKQKIFQLLEKCQQYLAQNSHMYFLIKRKIRAYYLFDPPQYLFLVSELIQPFKI